MLHVAIEFGGDGLGRSDEAVLRGLRRHQLAQGEPLGLGPCAQLGGAGDPIVDARGDLPQALLSLARILGGQRAVGIEPREFATPDGLDPRDRGLRARLRERDFEGALARLGIGVSEREGGARQDQQRLLAATGRGQPALDVAVERAPLLEARVTREDDLGVRGGEVAPGGRVSRLHDHRIALRAARHRARRGHLELLAAMQHAAHPIGVDEPAVLRIGDDRVGLPGVPERLREGDELLGSRVALLVGQVAAASEVAAVEGIRRGDDVPADAPAREVVDRGELTRELVGLVEGARQRADHADAAGDRGQRREDREGGGAARHVEVVDPAAVLAQAQALGEEDVVEEAALGGLGEVPERREVDLAARFRIAPDRRAVDTGEVRDEVHLPLAARVAAHAAASTVSPAVSAA